MPLNQPPVLKDYKVLWARLWDSLAEEEAQQVNSLLQVDLSQDYQDSLARLVYLQARARAIRALRVNRENLERGVPINQLTDFLGADGPEKED